MEVNKKSTLFLNGIKGVAAVGVFTHHFCLSFFPSIYYGAVDNVKLPNNLEIIFGQSALSFVVNGNFWVCVFLMLSAFVLTNKIYVACHEKNISVGYLIKLILDRYVSLCVPVFISSLFILILFKSHLLLNLEISNTYTYSPWLSSFYTEDLSVFELIRTSFWGVSFSGNSLFNTVFWMLQYILWGSFIAIFDGMLLYSFGLKGGIVMSVFAGLSLLSGSYYSCIFLGSILSQIWMYSVQSQKKMVWILILIFGAFLGGYPTGFIPNNYYKVLSFFSVFKVNLSFFFHVIGAFLLLLATIRINLFEKIFDISIFKFFAKYNFQIYLFHIPVLFSIGMLIFKNCYGFIDSYTICVILTYLVVFIVVILVSILYKKIVDDEFMKYIKYKINEICMEEK